MTKADYFFASTQLWYACSVVYLYVNCCYTQVYASKRFRAGKGKMRNRRRIQRRGPLIIYNKDQGITRAFRNIPGKSLLISLQLKFFFFF